MTNMLAPDIEVYAPWRDQAFLDRFRGRSEMIEYCRSRGLPIKVTKDAPYSTDANLLGLTHEAGKLESLETSPSFVAPGMGVRPSEAPDQAETVVVRFEKGRPISINGKRVGAYQAMAEANAIGGRNGVGIGTHLVENRFVGIKLRGVYEAPGMELLGSAYAYLIQLVLDRRARRVFRPNLDLDLETDLPRIRPRPCFSDRARGARPVVELATGTIAVCLHKGRVSFEKRGRRPSFALFRGELFDGSDRRIRPRRFGGFPPGAFRRHRRLAAAGQVPGAERSFG